MKNNNPLTSKHLEKSEWDKTWRRNLMDYDDKMAIEENTLSKRSSRYSGHY